MGYIVDMLLVVVVIFALVIVFGMPALPVLGGLGLFLSVFIVPLVYFPYFWAKSGQTPGMKMMNIKVVRDSDGGPITGGQAILRLIGYWVSQLVFYLGFIWIFIDKRQRGWFDLIAGTIVIKA
jgi:Predicted membrane protein/domain